MKVLVTGAAGFIGSRVMRQLAATPDVEAVALVRKSSDLWRLKACGLNFETGRPRLVHADLCDETSVDQVLASIRPEVLIHLAMAYHTIGSAGGPDVDAVNLQATVRLHQAFYAHGGRRFVAAGTCFEYGHRDDDRIEEDAPCAPCYEYARAKAQATQTLLAQGLATHTETLILRVFAPYGPLEEPRRIVPQLIAAGLANQRLALSPGEQVRDYIYVDDVARAFSIAALRPKLAAPCAIYNVCSGIGCSLKQLASAVSRELGKSLDLHWGETPYRPNEMMRLVGDNRRIKGDLGWQPSYSLQEGLFRTAVSIRSNSAPSSRAA